MIAASTARLQTGRGDPIYRLELQLQRHVDHTEVQPCGVHHDRDEVCLYRDRGFIITEMSCHTVTGGKDKTRLLENVSLSTRQQTPGQMSGVLGRRHNL